MYSKNDFISAHTDFHQMDILLLYPERTDGLLRLNILYLNMKDSSFMIANWVVNSSS